MRRLFGISLRPTSRRNRTGSRIATDRLSCCSTYYRTDDLCGARILDLLDFADDRLVYACTNGARGKTRACDLAYFLRFNIFKSLVYCIRIQGRYDLIINRRNIYIYTICYNNF